MKTVCDALDLARSNIAVQIKAPIAKPLGRPPQPDADLVAEIKAVIGETPTYGYRRVWAVLRRAAWGQRLPPPNHKRIYRIMKAHGLLLNRHAGGSDKRRHNGRIAVDRSNLRWCSDGFELPCDNGEKVRVGFALDCCDREAMGFVATTEGIKSEDVRDLMVTAVDYRFGPVNRLPETIEWLTTTAPVTSRIRPSALRERSASNPELRQWRARNQMEWRKPSCAQSSETTPASRLAQC